MIVATKDKVIVAPYVAQDQTMPNGIIVPASTAKREGQGLVVATGRECKNHEILVGCFVLYKQWAGTEVTIRDLKYQIIDEDDVIAILDEGFVDDLGMAKSEMSQKYFKAVLQPFRQGRLSKEYVESYPEQVKKLIETGSVTNDQVRDAKYVFRDIEGWKDWKKGKTK